MVAENSINEDASLERRCSILTKIFVPDNTPEQRKIT
jgi:hypothetical protein